ncbi:ATP-binding protein [Streptomyces sp. Ag109_G2-15]|uniref:ATP-binding protein n=1 Tax=Streptomyces sp. Ag109_G2-15 TaxID=1938850 RepID=UPI000BC7C7A8|nr:ATP-binding protein [Streptomyces sp. Ag109_G2-15]SOE06716.1 Histidine kinase-like ATPase domain-containing protein [Streptomyces sp. Ag109_G2-15]
MARAETQPTGGHSWRYELTTGHGVVAQCRAFTQQALLEWFGSAGAPGRKAADDAVLLVSEVVTNACTHGGLPSELKLTATERALWVQVSDNTREAPRPHGRHHAARASGHGLYLVQRLAARSGCVLRRHGGKTVWFEVDIVPEAEAPDRS